MDAAPPRWAESAPELACRPVALDAMVRSAKLRRDVLRSMEQLLSVATRLRGHRCAAEVLTAMWASRKRTLHASWYLKVAGPEFAACHGAVRNAWRNAMIRAGCGDPGGRDALDALRAVPRWLAPQST